MSAAVPPPGKRGVVFRGVNRAGLPVTGPVTTESVSAWVQDKFAHGWRELTVTSDDGREVGGIRKAEGRRMWWGER